MKKKLKLLLCAAAGSEGAVGAAARGRAEEPKSNAVDAANGDCAALEDAVAKSMAKTEEDDDVFGAVDHAGDEKSAKDASARDAGGESLAEWRCPESPKPPVPAAAPSDDDDIAAKADAGEGGGSHGSAPGSSSSEAAASSRSGEVDRTVVGCRSGRAPASASASASPCRATDKVSAAAGDPLARLLELCTKVEGECA